VLRWLGVSRRRGNNARRPPVVGATVGPLRWAVVCQSAVDTAMPSDILPGTNERKTTAHKIAKDLGARGGPPAARRTLTVRRETSQAVSTALASS